jgi:GNAT superfamily N-acetyltransferase
VRPGVARRATSSAEIRRASPLDARAIAAVMRAAVRGLAAHHPPPVVAAWSSFPPLYHRWAMTAGGETYWVAERAGRAIGYAALRRGEVTAVFVAPGAARAGTGTALMRRVEGEARRRGVTALRLVAASSAIPFYERLGYRPGRATSTPLPGGLALPARHMRKPLEPRARA